MALGSRKWAGRWQLHAALLGAKPPHEALFFCIGPISRATWLHSQFGAINKIFAVGIAVGIAGHSVRLLWLVVCPLRSGRVANSRLLGLDLHRRTPLRIVLGGLRLVLGGNSCADPLRKDAVAPPDSAIPRSPVPEPAGVPDAA